VLIKGIREDLFERQACFFSEIFYERIVPRKGNAVRKLGQIGIIDRVGLLIEVDFPSLGEIHGNGFFLLGAGTKKESQ